MSFEKCQTFCFDLNVLMSQTGLSMQLRNWMSDLLYLELVGEKSLTMKNPSIKHIGGPQNSPVVGVTGTISSIPLFVSRFRIRSGDYA